MPSQAACISEQSQVALKLLAEWMPLWHWAAFKDYNVPSHQFVCRHLIKCYVSCLPSCDSEVKGGPGAWKVSIPVLFLLCTNFKGAPSPLIFTGEGKEKSSFNKQNSPSSYRVIRVPHGIICSTFLNSDCLAHNRAETKLHRMGIFKPGIPWPQPLPVAIFHFLFWLWLHHPKMSNILKTS